jgi:hypothetical protein
MLEEGELVVNEWVYRHGCGVSHCLLQKCVAAGVPKPAVTTP